jgi:hypothetical protein
MESNQLEQAARLGMRRVTADPAFADGCKQLGIVQSRQGQAAAAIESLQTALS